MIAIPLRNVPRVEWTAQGSENSGCLKGDFRLTGDPESGFNFEVYDEDLQAFRPCRGATELAILIRAFLTDGYNRQAKPGPNFAKAFRAHCDRNDLSTDTVEIDGKYGGTVEDYVDPRTAEAHDHFVAGWLAATETGIDDPFAPAECEVLHLSTAFCIRCEQPWSDQNPPSEDPRYCAACYDLLDFDREGDDL